MRVFCILLLSTLWAHPLLAAMEPWEMLPDPALEARAQSLDAKLRCVVCRSENIASSNSDWASDARVLIRSLITEGKSDAEVLAFFQDRYGDYVLMDPPKRGVNWLLWGTAPALAVFGFLAALAYIRGRKSTPAPDADVLSEEEEKRLANLLKNE